MEREAWLRTAFGLPVDDTRRLTYEDYAEVLASVIAQAKAQGALSVYTYGEVSAPGISDLDVLVVSERPVRLELGGKARWVLGHSPEVLTPEHFEEIGRRVDTRNLQLAWGEDLGVPEVPEGAKLSLGVSYAAYRAQALHAAFSTRRLKARTLLRHLHALKYNFSLLGFEEPAFFKDVEALRGLWFSFGPGRLVDLLALAWEAFEVIEGFFSRFRRGEASLKKSCNWLWLEGEPSVPRPRPLPLRGKPAEALYYLKVFRARVPGEALKALKPSAVTGWRKALCSLATSFTRAG